MTCRHCGREIYLANEIWLTNTVNAKGWYAFCTGRDERNWTHEPLIASVEEMLISLRLIEADLR